MTSNKNSTQKLKYRKRKISDGSTNSSTSNEIAPCSDKPNNMCPPAPDQPIHVTQESLFTSSSGWSKFGGFFNLAILLLVDPCFLEITPVFRLCQMGDLR